MPLTLAVDCALRRINLGVSDGPDVLGEISIDAGSRQSELLPSSVENLLSATGHSMGDLGLVAVTKGPGYYTGIRVGLSYACALAWGLGINVASVSTLRAMALSAGVILASAGFVAPIAPIIPAGRDSFYAAVYGAAPQLGEEAVLEPAFVSAEDLMASLAALGPQNPPVLVGNGLPSDILKKNNCRIISPVPSMCSGVIRLAATCEPQSPDRVRASYIRDPY
ncbi:MAG: tRNA (adenosine(37)-N6)-threonylcarbamoyltransferase complex dimerization subunit type 1 TsaB [Synergistaceae bacterium]|jgi:tRNA threonylcarbamoyladenosine biosynthesis protein TsaB|nr:tRNA (adenosine(37)-N6)-threonylcarbamoyltransferase complex dimerization subunit type 1 TsaB [Synergistaceae bacterium]